MIKGPAKKIIKSLINVSIEANSVDPDQTLIWIYATCRKDAFPS